MAQPQKQYAFFVQFGTICILTLSGCSGLFRYEPYADTEKNAQGNVVLADTPRGWADFTVSVDRQIKDEASHFAAPGRVSWDTHWNLRIQYMRSGHQENPEKYVAYIIEKRERAGLPDLSK